MASDKMQTEKGKIMEYGLVVRVDGVQTVFTFDNAYDAVGMARRCLHIKGIETAIVFKEWIEGENDAPIYHWSAVDGLLA